MLPRLLRFCVRFWRRPTRKSACGPQVCKPRLQQVEPRLALTGMADLAMVAQDAASGDWHATQFDGEEYIQEKLFATAAWSAPLVGDINGDGTDAVVAFNRTTNAIHALRNSQGQVVDSVLASLSGTGWTDLQLGDIDGDGRQDVVLHDAVWAWWALCYDGEKMVPKFLGGWNPNLDWRHISLVDIDGDGRENVVAQAADNGDWWAIRFDGAGFYNQRIATWSPAATVVDVQAANLGDGRISIVGRDSLQQWHAIAWDGTDFSTRVVASWDTNIAWQHVQVADFNGDGADDFLGFDPISGNWWLTRINANGADSQPLGNWNPASVYANVMVADVTGDGLVDLVGQNVWGSWWAAAWNGERLVNVFLQGWNPSPHWNHFFAADITGDNRAEVIGWHGGMGRWYAITGSAGTYGTLVLDQWNPQDQYQVLLADMQGLGRQQIVGWQRSSGDWLLQTWQPTNASTQSIANWNVDIQVSQTWIADLTGAGRPSMIAFDAATGEWWMTEDDGHVARNRFLARWQSGAVWRDFLLGDVAGDGRQSILARDEASGHWWVLQHNGAKFVGAIVGNWNPANTYAHVQLADLTGNGKLEIVGQNNFGSWWSAVWNGERLTNQFLRGWNPGTNWRHFMLADINGDGRQSVVGYDSTTGRWWAIVRSGEAYVNQLLATWNPAHDIGPAMAIQWEPHGSTQIVAWNASLLQWQVLRREGESFTTHIVVATEATWSRYFVGSFFNDSTRQLLTYDELSKTWWMLQWTGGEYAFTPITLAEVVDDATDWHVADFNQNGRDELLWREPATGQWKALEWNGTQFEVSVAAQWSAAANWRHVDLAVSPFATNAELRMRILRENPALIEALANNRTAAIEILLHWTANQMDFALEGSQLIAKATTLADYFYDYYDHDVRGQSCGGFSHVFSSVLRLFGIDSIGIGVGYDPALTHSMTIVPEWTEDGWKFYIYDATFNTRYADTNSGDRLDYFEMLEYLGNGRVADIAVLQGSLDEREFVSPKPRSSDYLVFQGQNEHNFVYAWPGYGLDKYLSGEVDLFVAAGMDTGMNGFLQLVQQIVVVHDYSADGWAKAEFESRFSPQP